MVIFRSLLVLALFAALAVGQNFTYSDFTSVAGLSLNPAAAQASTATGNVLRITPSTPISQKGSVYYNNPMPVLTGFDTIFAFQITGLTAGGGDGMAFIIQNDPRGTTALGNHAAAMGYGAFLGVPAGTAIANSLVVEIDCYGNGNWGDPSSSASGAGNHISIHTNGPLDNSQDEAVSLGLVGWDPLTSINMSDGQPHTMRVRYLPGPAGIPGTLDVFVDDLLNPALSVPYDFRTGGTHVQSMTPVSGLNLIGGGSAWVGFTAGCGAATENHDVLSWQWTSTAFDPCFAGTLGATAGGPYDVLTVNGSAGSARLVEIPINTPMTVSVAQPPTIVSPANHLIFGKLAFADLGSSYPVPGFGTLCITPLGFAPDPLLFVFADSFGFLVVPPTLFPALPAPWNAPTFPVPFPLRFTLQGVMEETPGVLAITNAVMVDIY